MSDVENTFYDAGHDGVARLGITNGTNHKSIGDSARSTSS